MEELPECPVCLQNYDDENAIPRVLSCGHTVCEACLVQLHQRFPNTIRCPACTQLVKYSPKQGPSSLPKNIDLLRLFLQQQDSTDKNQLRKSNQRSSINSINDEYSARFWSDEFYVAWKDWILPHDAISVGDDGFGLFSSSSKGRVCFGVNRRVSLVPIVTLPTVSDLKFKFSYVAWIIKCLEGLNEVVRDGLCLILEASVRRGWFCRVYGLWGEVSDGTLYLVCERHCGRVLDKFSGLWNGDGLELDKGRVCSFAMIAKGVIEAVIALNLEGLVAGCLGLSCFSFEELGGVCIDLNEVLAMGRKIRDEVSGCMGDEHEAMYMDILDNEIFVSPEVLSKLSNKGVIISPESGDSRYPIGYGSDVWSLACVLLRLLIGNAFPRITLVVSEENGLVVLASYISWVEKVNSVLEEKFGSEYLSLKQTLCKCLDINPGSRPDVVDVRKCIQDVLAKHQFGFLGNAEITVNRNNIDHPVILAMLFQLVEESSKELSEHEVKEDGSQPDFLQGAENKSDEDFVASLSNRMTGMTELKDLQGHLGCITGLAVGGGYLFSSSFDKTVRVWSLQDFSHLHTFRGHENKVMALVYVDDEEPLCISGDGGGGLFVWGITAPLRQDPLRKWYEQKDWRFSGIHSLAAFGNLLYTGSGDRTIKAWSFKDGTLMCTMNGHQSVVSTLSVCDGVLYSGSWDGTIRLWSLNDHSPLAVLGENLPGEMKSILAITANRDFLVAAYENGCIKVWRNDVFMNSKTLHSGAIFAMSMHGKWLYTGGWDKNVNIQELSGDELELNVNAFGSIPSSSVVTAILCSREKLYVGYGDKSIKVSFFFQ
ncbi:hypothetical protein TSUD_376230 [Trifolium subterraneum]|uniref:RING-type domain-containing protein n=1 Tax=Trifolium subterraneum TaxID=3900 RepID=A0A2Z6M0F9_TRISU|nr:hypothetical protein TSUD_376230 [Trifolium subterraneum]